jgi:hypothetical protein
VAAYGRLLSLQLEPMRRYTILRVGAAEFAYTRYDQFVEALAQAWAEDLPAEQRPSVLGRDLPAGAPGLRGVDSDLSGLDLTELGPPAQLA